MDNITGFNDIADDLLILNQYTVDRLFSLDNPTDCLALYIFYYKTSKWQKTNIVKATDEYVKKALKWGNEKIRRTKNILKENGLINIVQRRKDGKIQGWYVEVYYLVNERVKQDVKVKVEEELSKNSRKPQVVIATSSFQETNALKEYIKCLNINNKNAYKGKSETTKKNTPSLEDIEAYIKEKHLNVKAKDFFDYFEAGNWCDSKGNKVKNWKQKLLTWNKFNKNTSSNRETYIPNDEPKEMWLGTEEELYAYMEKQKEK